MNHQPPRALRLPSLAFLFGAVLVGGAQPAQAHTLWTTPTPRDMMDGWKPTRSAGFVLPCGVARKPTQMVNKLQAGATVTVKWTETIPHPGCFIIDFAANDTGAAAVFERLKVVPHPATMTRNAPYTADVTLPAAPCTNCMIRIRQYMANANPCPPANLNDNNANLYYSCANVELMGGGGGDDASAPDVSAADATLDAPSTPIGGSGGTTGSGGSSGSGGVVGSGGTTVSGGSTGGTSGAKDAGPSGASTGSGGCAVAQLPRDSSLVLLALGLMAILARRRRT